MAIGSLRVGPMAARQKADECRLLVGKVLDLIEHTKAQQVAQRILVAAQLTLAGCTDETVGAGWCATWVRMQGIVPVSDGEFNRNKPFIRLARPSVAG